MNVDFREALATSLLAEVVCTELPARAIGTHESARGGLCAALLSSNSVDFAMADEIARRYALLSVYQADGSFDAAVFQDRVTHQLYLAIRGIDIASPVDDDNDAGMDGGIVRGWLDPVESLRRCLERIHEAQAAGTLPPGALTLTGHSLGGDLVYRAVFQHGLAASAYTFNACGVSGFPGLSHGLHHLLSRENHFVQNFIAARGRPVASSWLPGLDPGMEFVTFIEDPSCRRTQGAEPGFARHNDAIAPLVDALGVYRVLDLLAHGGQSFEQLTALLAATTRYSLETLESTLARIGRFFGIEVDGRYLNPRARMHDLSFRLIETLEGAAGARAGLLNLLGHGAPELARAAAADTAEGLAVRHALMHGLPFAVTGVDYDATVNADGRYDRERFSDEYLQARAEYAQLLFVANDADTLLLPARVIAPNTGIGDPEMGTVRWRTWSPGPSPATTTCPAG